MTKMNLCNKYVKNPDYWSLFWLLIFLLASPTSFADSVAIDRVAAIVNDGVVFNSQVEERLKSVYKQFKSRNEAPPEDVLRQQVLERLIVRSAWPLQTLRAILERVLYSLDERLVIHRRHNRFPFPGVASELRDLCGSNITATNQITNLLTYMNRFNSCRMNYRSKYAFARFVCGGAALWTRDLESKTLLDQIELTHLVTLKIERRKTLFAIELVEFLYLVKLAPPSERNTEDLLSANGSCCRLLE